MTDTSKTIGGSGIPVNPVKSFDFRFTEEFHAATGIVLLKNIEPGKVSMDVLGVYFRDVGASALHRKTVPWAHILWYGPSS